MEPHSRDRRRHGAAALAAALLLPAFLAGCEAEAVELVREIEAARGECTREGLRASDEECVRMMERYTALGTDLVHTYLGGLRALDMAIDRMPPPAFDTAGVGYALSPEFRRGDPTGMGSSPRLAPTRAAYSYGYERGTVASEGVRWDDDPGPRRAAPAARFREPARRAPAPPYDAAVGRGWDGADRSDRAGRYQRDRNRAYRDGGWNAGPGFRAPFGPGAGWAPFSDPFRTPYGSPYGYSSDGAYGYGYGYGYEDYFYGGTFAPSGRGVGPYGGGYGYEDYMYGGRYGPYGYDPYGGVYAPRAGYDPYAPGRMDPYGPPYPADAYGRYPAPGPAAAYEDLPPAQAWGYDAGSDPYAPVGAPEDAAPDHAADDDLADPRAATPARPAPHRPGILLPPEERLRRPWLDD